MPEVTAIAQFERRLVQLGCPSRQLASRVRELGEHHEDLKQASLEEGLSEAEAAARASDQLGDPILLAENVALLLRQSSWWGRHPILGFCVLPVVSFIPAWVAGFWILAGLCRLLGHVFGPAYTLDWQTLGTLSDDLPAFNSFAGPGNAFLTLAPILLVVTVFCRLARQRAVGLKWMLAVCAACSLFSCFNRSGLHPHSIELFLWWYPAHWIYPAIPLLIAAGLLVWQRRKERRLAWVPLPCRPTTIQSLPPKALQRRAIYQTPTYWVVTVFMLAIAALSAVGVAASAYSKTHRADLKSKIWPAERAATLAVLQARQAVPASAGENLIDLKPILNAALNDSSGQPAGFKASNLAELPAGVHTFGGVAFDIEGRLQLAGQLPYKAGQKFPARVQLPISGRCTRIYLLHGAGNLRTPGVKIARLVWHYADGSKAESAIVGGEQVLDFRGPIYDTDSGAGRYTTSPDTELAWAGSNPGIRKRAPNFSLRLYKSAFANPHPELEIARLDYVSTLSGAAPFLVGLTAESSSSPSP